MLVENELKKLKTFDSSYFIGKIHFEEDGAQNYLVFQPMHRYFKTNPTLVNCLFGAVSLTKMLTLISTNILDTELEVIFI